MAVLNGRACARNSMLLGGRRARARKNLYENDANSTNKSNNANDANDSNDANEASHVSDENDANLMLP